MPTPSEADDRARLKKKADYFFKNGRTPRSEVAEFARALAEVGPAVAIGGLLRDLLLSDLRRFRSDVDFVVDPVSMAEFESFAVKRQAARNSFGGYAIKLRHWKVDVWPLERTWARVAGHRKVDALVDLLGVTFFNWDAILYDVDRRRLMHRPGYFDAVRSGILDVNLAQTPNPLGNAVRALRYARRFNAAMAPRLAVHVGRQIRDRGWEAVIDLERKAFATTHLGDADGEAIGRRLADEPSSPVALFDPPQGRFVFMDEGAPRWCRNMSAASGKAATLRLASGDRKGGVTYVQAPCAMDATSG